MSNPFYAQDPTDLLQASNFIQQCMDAAPQWHWAVLVDSAFDHGRKTVPQRFDSIPCYARNGLDALIDASPQLVPLCTETAGAVLARLLKNCSARPMLSVVASEMPSADLAEAWHPYYWVKTDDGQRLLLRFADTRVLPLLQDVLMPAQWAGLTAPLKHWIYVARKGEPATCELAGPDTRPMPEIELTTEQLHRLVEATEADTLLNYFAEHLADTLPLDEPRANIHRRASLILDMAHAHGVEAWADKVALTMAEWLTGGAFRDDPRLVPLLQGAGWARDGLGERLFEENFI